MWLLKTFVNGIVFLNHYMESLVIEQGRIFIEGVETTDPNLIGYAIIDLVQDGKTIVVKDIETNNLKDCIKDKYFSFLKAQNLSFTTERKLLIDVLSDMNNLSPYELFEKATELNLNISRQTIYNFLDTCVASEILELQPRIYTVNPFLIEEEKVKILEYKS